MGRFEFETFFAGTPNFDAPTPGLAHRAYWTKPAVAVDLCCGQGKNLPPLLRHAGKVIAVDLSKVAIEDAKARLVAEHGRVPRHISFWEEDARRMSIPRHDFLVYTGNLFLVKPKRVEATLSRLQGPANPGAVHVLTAYAEGGWAKESQPRTYRPEETGTLQSMSLSDVIRAVEKAYAGWNWLRIQTRPVRTPVMRDGRRYFWKGKEVIFEFKKSEDGFSRQKSM